jgi:hypothetical protein
MHSYPRSVKCLNNWPGASEVIYLAVPKFPQGGKLYKQVEYVQCDMPYTLDSKPANKFSYTVFP